MTARAWCVAALALGACATPVPPAAPVSTAPAVPVSAPAASATVPSLPPGTPVAIVNAGFDSDRPGIDDNPEGWATSQHAGDKSYEFVTDAQIRRSGTRSFKIRNTGSEPYGAIHQAVPAAGMRGRNVRLSAWLRTDAANGEGAMLTLRALGGGSIAAHKFMDDAVTGTRDWRQYAITLAVPANTDVVDIGAMLVGKGTLWFDDVVLVVLP